MSEQIALRMEGEDQFRAIANPLRRQILELLAIEPMEARALAERIGVAKTLLYRHLDVLAGVGLVEVVETRKVRGLESRTFRAKPIPMSQAGEIAQPPTGFERLAGAQITLSISLKDLHAAMHSLVSQAQNLHSESGEELVLTITADRKLDTTN